MFIRLKRLPLALCGAGLLTLAACGGSDDSDTTSGTPVTTPASTTTDVSATVIDGPLSNVVVCLDANQNGVCDTGEVRGTTNASGVATLTVANADVGKYPLLAVVTQDSTDANTDIGKVLVPYTLSAPAGTGTTLVVSPLTTLVQKTISSVGLSTDDAVKSVQAALGITASPLADYTKAAASTDTTVAATVARLLVVTYQQQNTALASQVDNTTVTQADLDKVILANLLQTLPSLVAAASTSAVLAATGTAKETALAAAATTLVAASGLTTTSVPALVAIDKQAVVEPVTTAASTGGFTLASLNVTDASNYFIRFFTASAAQDTPDSGNLTRYVDRRLLATAGNLAKWGAGGSPARGTDLHWNGSAWANCPINFENTSTVRDAQGNSSYNYCDGLETGRGSRTTVDVAGKSMADVYAQVRAAGYTNLTLGAPTALGTATFPANAKLLYQTSTSLTEAYAYYPAGANSPVGASNVASQYSAEVSAGGDATQTAGAACNSTETQTNGVNATTLAGLIALKTGSPCKFGVGSFVYAGTTYTSDAVNEWWGQSTVSLGKLGTAPVGSGTAPGYYTGNTLLRIAFTGTGTNPVTYYACKERFNNGSVRNCVAIGTGSYAITTLGDAKVMTLANPPAQAAPLTYNRVFVERGGLVYLGYQTKLGTTSSVRLNATGGTALLTQLGLPVEDPATPLALTAGSYQGTWDLKHNSSTDTFGSPIFINANGTSVCQDGSDQSYFACQVTITDPVTGAFTIVDTVNGTGAAAGTFDFLAGTASGTYHDETSTPVDGTFSGGRR